MARIPRPPRKAYTEQLAFFVEPTTFTRLEAFRRRGLPPDAPGPDRSSTLRYILDKGLAAIEGESASGPVST